MGNGVTNNMISQIKKKLAENIANDSQIKKNDPPSFDDELNRQIQNALMSENDKKSTLSLNPQQLLDLVGQITLIKAIPKLLGNALTDGTETQFKTKEYEELMRRLEQMEERYQKEREEQRQKELIESAIKPFKEQISRLESLVKENDTPKKSSEVDKVEKAISDLEGNISKVLTSVREENEDKKVTELRRAIENVESSLESQYNSLLAIVSNAERGRERPQANPTGGIKEALKQLQEEKELMKQLGMIKENIDDGGDLKSAMDSLKDVTSRVPELVESGKTIYDMLKGNKNDDYEDEEIPPYENTEMSAAPVLERKAVELPAELQVYLMRGEEIPDPVDPKRKIWVDEWGNGYNHPTTGRYMTKNEIEMQMKLKPDEIRKSMEQSKAYYEERMRNEAKVKMEVNKGRPAKQPQPEEEEETEEEEQGEFSPDEDEEE